jgi:RNA polymerase sigma-70 factor (ECF subfamily)
VARRVDLEALTPGLRRYARGLTGDVEAADDLVQDAVLAALRSAGLGRGPALRRRLYAIVTDFNRLRTATLACSDDFGGEARGEIVPFRREQAARPALAESGLAEMTLAEREAILLVAVEGFCYADAADIAGVSRSALVARLAKARAGTVRPAAPPAERAARSYLRVVS